MDTIVGILTGNNSGVSIIRLSGQLSYSIAKDIFTNKIEDHKISYGHIKDKEIVDEVLLTYMAAPKSYTKEDVIEINCHGGIVNTNILLELLIRKGARLAEPGEFSKRAFLNGRIDLAEAEAIMSLINSKTEKEHNIALKQLRGQLSKEIENYRSILLMLLAQIEASIDYPEHDMEHDNLANVEKHMKEILLAIEKLIEGRKEGKLIKEGIETAIIGTPNVGKSSLLNKLVGEEIAIVTDIAGTTRDTVKEYINVKGIVLKIIDTAGIRNTNDVVEKIGVDKSLHLAKNCELVIFILDNSKEATEEELNLFRAIESKKICIINKIDLNRKIDISKIEEITNNIIEISLKDNIGLDKFYCTIEEMFLAGFLENENTNLIINNRHYESLIKAKESLNQVLEGIELSMTEDLLVIDIKDAYTHLGHITGASIDEDIIDKIFAEFCLGK
ncbi:MAG: tRNA uridine-5-carboxymethylaminomethyl(34) synthesis GTPase MnmE [Lachnospirales bacterium]